MDYNSLMKLKKAKLVEKVLGLQNDVAQLEAKLEAQQAPKSKEVDLPKNYWNDAFAEEMVRRGAGPEAVFKWLQLRSYSVEIDGKLRHLYGIYVKNKMISLKSAS